MMLPTLMQSALAEQYVMLCEFEKRTFVDFKKAFGSRQQARSVMFSVVLHYGITIEVLYMYTNPCRAIMVDGHISKEGVYQGDVLVPIMSE